MASDRCLHDSVYLFINFFRHLLVLKDNNIELRIYIVLPCHCLPSVEIEQNIYLHFPSQWTPRFVSFQFLLKFLDEPLYSSSRELKSFNDLAVSHIIKGVLDKTVVFTLIIKVWHWLSFYLVLQYLQLPGNSMRGHYVLYISGQLTKQINGIKNYRSFQKWVPDSLQQTTNPWPVLWGTANYMVEMSRKARWQRLVCSEFVCTSNKF